MQVVVLAGGIGSRLRPWTNDIPKPLLPMPNIPAKTPTQAPKARHAKKTDNNLVLQ